MTTPVRRSNRARKQVFDPYQAELDELAKKMTPKKYGDDESDEDDESSSSENEKPTAQRKRSNSEDEDNEDPDDADDKPKTTPRKKPKISNSPPKVAPTRKTKISKNTTSQAAPIQGLKNSLRAVARKILDESETPDTSLVAALLNVAHQASSSSVAHTKERRSSPTSPYTPQLEGIAKRLLKENPEPSALHVQLLNLVFRSVGGSVDTMLESNTDLEDLDDEAWDDVVSKVVTVMQDTDADCTLLCADPLGAASSSQSSKAVSRGLKEYRSIYEEFWFRLGDVILSGATSTKNANSYDDDESSSSDETGPPSSSRFDLETVRELIVRLMEVVPVGQPDLRAGATISVLQLGLACLERSVELEAKLEVAGRQFSAAAKSDMLSRMQMLQHTMDAWKRQSSELEELVKGHVMQAVFMQRYRDSNEHIRRFSLECLSKMSLIRPDWFLVDKYLKYLGWMCSDKNAVVRLASVRGLLAPFREVFGEKQRKGPAKLKIQLSSMNHVCGKFLSRFVDCIEDKQSVEVQEVAMELLLAMLKESMLDDWEDDFGWDQVNLKSMDKKTSPKVRKDALSFVLEQLDSFDVDSDEPVSEKKQVERLEDLTTWIANKLCDGPIPVDKIRISLADLIVRSLREIPDHKALVTNWTVILKAIRPETPQRKKNFGGGGREAVAKQRIILRMLATSAEIEYEADASGDSPDPRNRKRKRESKGHPQEALSLALLKSLPKLLGAHKGDVMSLRSLTTLPRFLNPAVFGLSSRKNEFCSLIKQLCATFVESTDETVLQNVACVLVRLARSSHSRVSEVKVELKKLSVSLRDRFMLLLGDVDLPTPETKALTSKRRSSRSSDASQSTLSSAGVSEATATTVDREHAIYLCLLRIRILAKLCPISLMFDEDEEEVEDFCNTVSEAIAKRLEDRKPVMEDIDDATDGQTSTVVPAIWRKENPKVHAVVARSVDETLNLLLSITAWKLHDTLTLEQQSEKDDDGNNEEESDTDANDAEGTEKGKGHCVLRMRDRLVRLLGFCFEQFLDEEEDLIFSDEHMQFASAVQAAAGRVSSDVRTLFPREWSRAGDSLRRSLGLTADSGVVAGFNRYLRSREPELRELSHNKAKNAEQDALINDLILPVARGLTANWNDGNRREAAVVMAHIAGSGAQVSQSVHSMTRLLKKVNPVRFLEAQMACIRIGFEKWLHSDPEEVEDDRPTEEQIRQFEEESEQHKVMFTSLEQQASRLSMSLGVGRLTDKSLAEKMLGFMMEGIRFAFDGDAGVEDDFLLGSRLPFLLILSKYSNWIKKNKKQLQRLKEVLEDKEAELESHPNFDEVHEDDLAALDIFRESLGFKRSGLGNDKRGVVSPNDTDGEHSIDHDEDTAKSATPSQLVTPASSKSSRRNLSTASSTRSRVSAQSSLSPLLEEDDPSPEASSGRDDEEMASPEQPHTGGSSHGGSLNSKSTVSRIDEGDEGSEKSPAADDEESASPQQYRRTGSNRGSLGSRNMRKRTSQAKTDKVEEGSETSGSQNDEAPPSQKRRRTTNNKRVDSLDSSIASKRLSDGGGDYEAAASPKKRRTNNPRRGGSLSMGSLSSSSKKNRMSRIRIDSDDEGSASSHEDGGSPKLRSSTAGRDSLSTRTWTPQSKSDVGDRSEASASE